jgi:unsaturated chondroitin disaccharide hydrolase
MKNLMFFLILIGLNSFAIDKKKERQVLEGFIEITAQKSLEQYKLMEASLPIDLMPRSIDKEGKLVTSPTRWWCSGFYPGTLWYIYELTSNKEAMSIAHSRTMLLEPEKHNTRTHDVGFIINCSYGNAYRLTGNSEYLNVMSTASETLFRRYRQIPGLIKSWDNPRWQYPVIIDNMMNLELLLFVADKIGKMEYYNACVSHADKTIEHHFRDDFSSYHLVDYDTLSGKPIHKQTHQGAFDESAWARGQAWGLYGYTVMYRKTSDKRYLEQAQKIADFILNHPNLPSDKIPYWDFNADDIPNSLRDASAAAIIASALLELSDYSKEKKSKVYRENAKNMLLTLGSDKYMAKKGENGNFLLKHSVGHLPANSEVDVPLSYADYYFMEGLVRLKQRIGKF